MSKTRKSKEQREKQQLNAALKSEGEKPIEINRWLLRLVLAMQLVLERNGVLRAVVSFKDVLRERYGYSHGSISRFDSMESRDRKNELAYLSANARRFVGFMLRKYKLTIVPVTDLKDDSKMFLHAHSYVGFSVTQGPNGDHYARWQKMVNARAEGMLDAGGVRVAGLLSNGMLLEETVSKHPDVFAEAVAALPEPPSFPLLPESTTPKLTQERFDIRPGVIRNLKEDAQF